MLKISKLVFGLRWAVLPPYIKLFLLLALPTKQGKDIIVFRFIIEYSSLRHFYRPLGNNNNNRSFFFYMRIFER
jgi:hypothetical protein